ncbi:MAG: hypothetical protein HFK10_08565 [Clostridia bacterium]|nr:hypothetical protein [Clostridia bacterium]
MVKTKSKRTWTTAISLLLGLLLALGALHGLPIKASAADEDGRFVEYPNTPVTDVTNRQFDDSGSYPVSPSGWTESALDGVSKGNTKSGVISLDAKTYSDISKEKHGLYKYPEYKDGADIPRTPFGTAEYKDTNKKVLLINTDGSETAFGYTSSTFTLEPNSFYSISVYVKTGDFKEGTGATVRLSGVDVKGDKDEPNAIKELAFRNINTVDKDRDGNPVALTKDNLYGFKQYKMYVETSYVSSTASLVLAVGDKVTDADKGINYFRPANGYAFFDNIEINRMSPTSFRHETQGIVEESAAANKDGRYIHTVGTTTVALLNRGETVLNGDFQNETGWTRVETEDYDSGNAVAGLYNANQTFSEGGNPYHLTADPVSPIGKTYDNEKPNNIFVLSSYSSYTEKYADVAAAYRSVDFTVERHSYTRLSVWVKTQDLEGNASIAVVGKNVLNDNEKEELEFSQTVTGDDSNASRYGWKEYAFYIKGSTLKNYDVHLELRLGSKDSTAKGVAMFGDIRSEKITYSEYNTNSAAETQVTFDGTYADTGVANGLFMNAGDYELDENGAPKYPLTPAEWTSGDAATVGTPGFATDKVETEGVASGIVPIDDAHFNAHRKFYNDATNPIPGGTGNLLLISASKPTAVYYASPSLTVAASTNYALTVSLKTDRIEGYGASLVLKNSSGAVVSTIENITNTYGQFKDYTFYIEGGAAEKTVTVELWLGLNDRKDNSTKLSTGDVFVKKVALTSVTEAADMTAKADGYIAALKNNTVTGPHRIAYSYYSFKVENLTAFDVYDDSVVKTAYNWSLTDGKAGDVKYGIFNAAQLPAGQTEIPAGFDNGAYTTPGVLYLHNTSPTYARILSSNTFNLAENTYHKMTVRLKVDLPESFENSETAIGAGVELTGTDFKFKDIRKTAYVADTNNPSETTDREYYREFTFYIRAEAATDVGVAITLGGNKFSNEHVSGRVYVNSIDVQEISNTEYEMKEAEIAALEEDDKTDPYTVLAHITAANTDDSGTDETPSEEETGGSAVQWWLIPSILFAVAILIAVVGFTARKLVDKRSKRKTTEKMPEYDRRATLHKQHNRTAKDEDKVETVDDTPADDTTYDTFDDETDVKPVKAPADAATESVENAATDETPETPESTAEASEQATESSEASTEETEKPTEETAKSEPTEETQKPKTVAKPDAYTDEFDD